MSPGRKSNFWLDIALMVLALIAIAATLSFLYEGGLIDCYSFMEKVSICHAKPTK